GVRDVDLVVGLAQLGLGAPDQGLHLHQVDDALEVRLGADRQLHDQRGGLQPGDDHVDAAVELRAGAVQLVDEADARDTVTVGLPPDRLGLRLHAGDTVEHRDRAVEHAQRALHLDGEVDVPGRVDDVDRVVDVVHRPVTGDSSGGDRDATL